MATRESNYDSVPVIHSAVRSPEITERTHSVVSTTSTTRVPTPSRIQRHFSSGEIDRNRCCLCSNFKRQQCCLNILGSKIYPLLYLGIILIVTVTCVWDLRHLETKHVVVDLRQRPLWFIAVNGVCLFLMVMDLIIHIQAFRSNFFKSIANWIDFIFVMIVTAVVPVYWFLPAYILQVLFFFRFVSRLFRRRTMRKQYLSSRNINVDFSLYEGDSEEIQRYMEENGFIDTPRAPDDV